MLNSYALKSFLSRSLTGRLLAVAIFSLLTLSLALSASTFASPARAVSSYAELPDGATLHGFEWATDFTAVGINPADAALTPTPDPLGPDLGGIFPSGVGYDSSHDKVWFTTSDCKLRSLTETGAAFFESDIAQVNAVSYPGLDSCQSFALRGDGTAYISAKYDPGSGLTSAKLWVLTLATGALSTPVDIAFPSAMLDFAGATQNNITTITTWLSPVNFAINPITDDLWVIGQDGYYTYRLSPSGQIDHLTSDFALGTSGSFLIWTATFDANGTLWGTLYDQPFGAQDYLVRATYNESSTSWDISTPLAFTRDSNPTYVEELWIESAPAANNGDDGLVQASNTLADTGVENTRLLLSLALLTVAVGGAALGLRRYSTARQRR